MLVFGLVSGVVKVFLASFLSSVRKIDKEGTSTARPDDEIRSQIGRVTSRHGQDMYKYDRDKSDENVPMQILVCSSSLKCLRESSEHVQDQTWTASLCTSEFLGVLASHQTKTICYLRLTNA